MHVLSTPAGLQQFMELLFAPPNRSGMKTAINPLDVYKPPAGRTWNSELPSCLPSLSVDRNGLSGHLLTAGLREEAALHL